MDNPFVAPAGSRWSSNHRPSRVFVVLECITPGRVCIKEDGQTNFGDIPQKLFFANFTRLDTSAQ